MTEFKKNLRALNSFHEIDFQFAEWVLSKETDLSNSEQETLFSAVLCLSFFASTQHSALPLKEFSGLSFAEFSRSDEVSDLKIDFTNFAEWKELFPNTVGDLADEKPLLLDKDNGLLYLYKYYHAEKDIASFVRRLVEKNEAFDVDAQKLEEIFLPLNENYKVYDPDWQKVAAFTALRNKFCVISGGPGTGKTTTVAKILTLLLAQDPSLRIDIVAPTGKAADRLAESIRKAKAEDARVNPKLTEEASTIHRYLGYHGGTKKFKMNAQNQTDSDVLLVDEASMVSLPMFRSLLSALKSDCRVILLGDKDQLTAVETGNVLGDLTDQKNINEFSKDFCEAYAEATGNSFDYVSDEPSLLSDLVVKLEHSYRFQSDSGIGHLATLVNTADESTTVADFEQVFADAQAKADVIVKSYEGEFVSELQKYEHFKAYKVLLQKNPSPQEVLAKMKEFQILCPSRTGSVGVDLLNEQIVSKIFKANERLFHGRCIMIRKNNKELKLFNGDVGVVLRNEAGELQAYFPSSGDEVREFSPTVLPDYETAFAMTIHKSQGSEYSKVIIPLPMGENRLLTKELLYTGITRAKASVVLYSNLRQLKEVSQLKTKRYSGFNKRLAD